MMDLQFLSKGLDFCKKRKKWVLLCAFFGASSYGTYRVYQLPGVARKRRKLFKLLTAFFSMAELVSDSAETIGVVSKEMKEFLRSDSDEIPKSLRQISKIATSDEFSDSLTRVSEALTVGILRGYRSEISSESGVEGSVSFTDKVMDKILSSAGTGFVSVIAGSFARNLVQGFYSSAESVNGSCGNGMANGTNDKVDLSSVPRWVNVICADKCKDLMANCIQVFVSTAVAAYLDKTLDINAFDEIFAGLANPNHENKMKDMLVSVCNGAVQTFVKTSHHLLTSKNRNSNTHSSLSNSSVDDGNYTTLNGQEFNNGEKEAIPLCLTDTQVSNDNQGGSWSGMVLSTLSVPSNRRFVLDVTGRVTFETFKSVLQLVQGKVTEGLERSSYAVHDHIVHKGRQAVQYFGLKSYVCFTICFALLLHMICSTRALLPA
uniref:Protein PHLOEM PROTEIN 2-LIKE A10 n=1 Tax=Opuntia streptacantha TaxID=393608 RepID=A0A7C9ANC2_OPUST